MAKKGKKGKKGKKVEEEEEETEYDRMDLQMLSEVVPMLEQQLEASKTQRNWTQLERDTVQTFYDVTRKEVKDLEMSIAAKDRAMELMEDNHRVEVRVYVQKVKHLEYEHKNNLKAIDVTNKELKEEEEGMHEERSGRLKGKKKELNGDLKDKNTTNAQEISNVKVQHEKILQQMRDAFEVNLSELGDRCEKKLEDLEEDLELRRKVDIHEIEERKNLHINDLMRNHERAFGQMKSYYNDITNDNLQLIKDLKSEVVDKKKKAIGIQKVMYDIAQENKRLSEPLSAAVAEVADLRAQLKDQEKDRLSLRNAKARLIVMENQLQQLAVDQAELKQKYDSASSKRDGLYDTFTNTVKEVQAKSDFKNLVLEQKLQGLGQNIEKAEAQLNEVVMAAQVDPGEVGAITSSIDEMLSTKNQHIKDLQYAVLRMTKAYNDGLRTYGTKLKECGIPEEEFEKMGFEYAPTATSIVPAGLLVKNS
ncbi:hypothetical protein TrLO_g9003 [Triparma laevis f. longispina]|uniref:Growth arrest-specific protein 8 domain-containing protein n=2 Tax=Triparma laevis TaxID=1534972 RepID=A0A9W7FEC6_9STRA|nr:hypothetical protein TrLO_g9003 [Triparma laevis f. longispina]